MTQAIRSLTAAFPISITNQKIRLVPIFKLFWVFVLLIIFSLLAALVYQINIYTSEIYFIHNSEKEIAQLSQENKILEINLAKANSLLNVESYVQSFEKTAKMEYVRVLEDTALAK